MARVAIYVDEDLTRLKPEYEIAWREWWRAHGLPPLNEVSVPNRVIINTFTRIASLDVYQFVGEKIRRDKQGRAMKVRVTRRFKGKIDEIPPFGFLVEHL